jgi:hypothetical protein
MDIHEWTDSWFSEERRAERRKFIERELQQKWRNIVSSIRSRVAPVSKAEVPAVA